MSDNEVDLRCAVTGNECGTDTIRDGHVCTCAPCRLSRIQRVIVRVPDMTEPHPSKLRDYLHPIGVDLSHESKSVDELEQDLSRRLRRRLGDARFVTYVEADLERVVDAVLEVVRPPVFRAHWLNDGRKRKPGT